MRRRDREPPEGEVPAAGGERVLVEEQLLAGGLAGDGLGVGRLGRAGGAPAVQRVLEALAVRVKYSQPSLRTGAETSVSSTRATISSKIRAWRCSVCASAAFVKAFSASRYAITSGLSRSRSQYQSSTRSSPS